MLFYTEYQRKGGHPDFVYWRRKFEALDIEEKTRNELVKQAIDRMMNPEKYEPERPIDLEEARERAVKMLQEEEKGIDEKMKAPRVERPYEVKYWWQESPEKYGKEYGDKLKKAKTLYEAEQIINDYQKHYQRKKVGTGEQVEEPKKKKHWWQ